ncbi:MAG: hypothetical protein HY926_02970 [Elusimicrobia bacterium]|nr:hypothetical protein [Elusimicrobiota bacterium]
MACPAAWGSAYEGLARDLSRAARRAGIRTVAVAPFQSADGAESREGWFIAEELSTDLVRAGRLRVVERNLLGALFDEERLARTGALGQRPPRLSGGLVAADGIVTGSYASVGGKLRVEARLVDAASGLVVAAARERAARLLLGAPAAAGLAPARPRKSGWSFLIPEFDSSPPTEFLEEPLADFLFQPARAERVAASDPAMRDAVADNCADARRSVDEMESRVLELKARYWALRLRRGPKGAWPSDPGASLSDPELKRRFYAELGSWSARPDVRELDVGELLTLLMIDHKAGALREKCRL